MVTVIRIFGTKFVGRTLGRLSGPAQKRCLRGSKKSESMQLRPARSISGTDQQMMSVYIRTNVSLRLSTSVTSMLATYEATAPGL